MGGGVEEVSKEKEKYVGQRLKREEKKRRRRTLRESKGKINQPSGLAGLLSQ